MWRKWGKGSIEARKCLGIGRESALRSKVRACMCGMIFIEMAFRKAAKRFSKILLERSSDSKIGCDGAAAEVAGTHFAFEYFA